MSQKICKICFGILICILSIINIPKIIIYGIELYNYISVEFFSMYSSYRIIQYKEVLLQVIPTVIFSMLIIAVACNKMFVSKKNIILSVILLIEVLINLVWISEVDKTPWEFESRIVNSSISGYTAVDVI